MITNAKEFVFISNAEYANRIADAYNNGYRHGRSEAITKMTNLVTLTYSGLATKTPPKVNTAKKANTKKTTKGAKK
jgi:hypothetical protein